MYTYVIHVLLKCNTCVTITLANKSKNKACCLSRNIKEIERIEIFNQSESIVLKVDLLSELGREANIFCYKYPATTFEVLHLIGISWQVNIVCSLINTHGTVLL